MQVNPQSPNEECHVLGAEVVYQGGLHEFFQLLLEGLERRSY